MSRRSLDPQSSLPDVPTRGLRRLPSPRRVAAAILAAATLFGLGYATGSGPLAAPEAAGATSGAGLAATAAASRGFAHSDAQDSLNAGSYLDAAKSPSALLLKCQLPSGAIKVKPDDDRIVPYFANLAAMALVSNRPADVRSYLEWYLAHLNRPDRYGLQGTVYDYTVDNAGQERPTGRYDSADSYAATFLTLLRAYVDATGDREFVTANLADIDLVASVISRLQDADGLVWATASRREKYLMDNAENYRGLKDYAEILTGVGATGAAAAARDAAQRVATGVESRLWDAKRGNYDWGIYTFWLGGHRLGELSRRSSWKSWYPDTVAQVFPVITGLLQPSDPRAVSLYENFNTWHPGWVNQSKRDPHPWSVLGYAAAVMGDKERALAFARATSVAYLDSDGPYSGLSWELAWHLMTLRLASGLSGGAVAVPAS